MPSNRRDFLKTGAAAALVVSLPRPLVAGRNPERWAEPLADELLMEALNAAKSAGYADARIGRYRRQSISTRERQITGVNESESYGIGIRTIVNGAWGFAATSVMTKAKAAREAARLSRAESLSNSDRLNWPLCPL
ncbi:MAG: PmbA/TldA family metallopeptidase [Gemmatimonadaceae bacterium]